MDRLYLRYRAGRWIAANRANTVTHNVYLHPLLDNAFVRRALALPVEYRHAELVARDLIRRLAPSISDLPLAYRRWRCDAETELTGPEHAAWVRRAPVTLDATVTPPDWRRALPGCLRDEIRAQMSDPAAAEIYDVVDRSYVERLLGQPTGGWIVIWRLMTLSVLADGSWEKSRPGDLDVVTVPRPTAKAAFR